MSDWENYYLRQNVTLFCLCFPTDKFIIAASNTDEIKFSNFIYFQNYCGKMFLQSK